jgi:hypothetical protein
MTTDGPATSRGSSQGGVVAIQTKHVLLAVGIVFVITGHLGDGTTSREVAFWLGVVLSVAGLGLEMRDGRRA